MNQQNVNLEQAILRCMPEAMIFADLKGIILQWNQGAQQVFGFSQDDAIGQSLDLIIPERMRKAHWDGYFKAVERGATLPGRSSAITGALHKSGERIYVDMSFSMVTSADAQLLGSLAIARDATARFAQEKALRKQLADLQSGQSS